jgi:hypothetical protein
MINQTATTIQIEAAKLNLTGYITASSLATAGSTVINGSNITTGTVAAARIDVDNLYVKHLSGTDGSFSGTLSAYTTLFNNLQSGNVTISGSSILSSGPFTVSSAGGSGYNFLSLQASGGVNIQAGGGIEFLQGTGYDIRMANLKSSTGSTVVFGPSNGNLAYNGSSCRYKHNIQDADTSNYRDIIDQLRIRTFIMNNDEFNEVQLGAIAEEVDEFCPILVGYKFMKDGTKIPDFLKYERLPLIMLPVLKDALAEIDVLKGKITLLEAAL